MSNNTIFRDKISVIVPVYNSEKYINRCLNSILKNTYDNLEIICINDGSTDNSLEKLLEIQSYSSKINVINVNNSGVSNARNIGLKNATGAFIAFIDSDDYVHINYFSELIKYQILYDADITTCSFLSFKDNNGAKDEEAESETTVQVFEDESALEVNQLKVSVWGRIYKTSILSDMSFFDKLSFGEDTLLNLELYCKFSKLRHVYISKALYYYNIHNGSLSSNSNYYDYLKMVQLYLDRTKLYPDSRQKRILLSEVFSWGLSNRYLSTYSGQTEYLDEYNNVLSNSLTEMKKYRLFSFFRSLSYFLFVKIPLTYRLFRLLTDKTMINWEKEQRRKKKLRDNHLLNYPT